MTQVFMILPTIESALMGQQKPKVNIFRSAGEMELASALEIVRIMKIAVEERGVGQMGLSGGETPRSVYKLLGSQPLRSQVDWEKVHLFFSDERMVPPDDAGSNYRMVEQELLSAVDIPPANVHRIKGEFEPGIAAKEYDRELSKMFPNGRTEFDLMLLGLGGDGHTASLFPGTAALSEDKAFATSLFVPHLGKWRVTLTYRSINSARAILFLVSGRQKSKIVRQIFDANEPSITLPATCVRPTHGSISWFFDEEAAALINP